jgi:hypothetical protein
MHNWRTVQLSMSELRLSLRALMPVTPVMELADSRPRAHLRNPRRMGEVCLQGAAQAADVQGGRIAGFGAYDVTDTKFSIRLGPPSCSPPV